MGRGANPELERQMDEWFERFDAAAGDPEAQRELRREWVRTHGEDAAEPVRLPPDTPEVIAAIRAGRPAAIIARLRAATWRCCGAEGHVETVWYLGSELCQRCVPAVHRHEVEGWANVGLAPPCRCTGREIDPPAVLVEGVL
jgi:hypothetical protein